ncbi:UNVERIFIED_CONTAM: hypothetical protein Sindi_0917700, partial [Sesamum indicum]
IAISAGSRSVYSGDASYMGSPQAPTVKLRRKMYKLCLNIRVKEIFHAGYKE